VVSGVAAVASIAKAVAVVVEDQAAAGIVVGSAVDIKP
jgi:hypothetical protein